MFIKSQTNSFVRNSMTHAMVDAALKCNLDTHKTAKMIGDTFVKQRATQWPSWTANVHSFKQKKIVSQLMA